MSTQASFTGNGDNLKTLVVVFLRGGADGLNMVSPVPPLTSSFSLA